MARRSSRAYEAIAARLQRRRPCELYHSALVVEVPEGRFVIEQAPAWWSGEPERGVVATGAVASRWAPPGKLFRYEIRCWQDGRIPDAAMAVDSPRRLGGDPNCARRIVELAPTAPTPVWGRDELRTGEMWSSNSIVAWLIARAGLAAEEIHPPAGGRAPGWYAGVVVARR